MILLMGVAGAGKSLEGRRLADELALPWLSTGEFLRMLVAGDRRREMLAGKLLSDEEVIELADRVFRIIDVKEEFLLDGFPRTQAQADWLLAQHKAKLMNITAVINLEASQEVVRERLLGRGRQDDTAESIAERFNEYESVTLPIISNLEAKGIKVHNINAAQTPDEVHREVLIALGV
ncbi:MAG: nucleoside monophosphate kinase [bacterium]|nr:nucleoside monophosphate kinase [bacterium]